jgi:hypothetical protein
MRQPPVSQPDLVILPPKHRYSLHWDPPASFQIVTFPEYLPGEIAQADTRLPVLSIKNLGSAVAHEVTVQWEDKIFGLETMVEKSPRFSNYKTNFSKGEFTVGNEGASWSVRSGPLAFSQIPYLAPEIDNKSSVDLPIPYEIYSRAEIYFAAVLRDEIGATATAEFYVLVSWKRPEGGVPQGFRVRATALSTKPSGTGDIKVRIGNELRSPMAVMGTVKFEVERM